MAVARVSDFQIAEKSDSGDATSRRHVYHMFTSDDDSTGDQYTDEQIWTWLNNSQSAFGFTHVRHDGTEVTSGYPIPPVYDDMPVNNIRYQQLSDKNPQFYKVTVDYKQPKGKGGGGQGLDPPTGEASIEVSFGIGPEQRLIKQSLATKSYVPSVNPGETKNVAPNYLGAVNVSANGEVEGVDSNGLQAPIILTVSYTDNKQFFTSTKIKQILSLRGATNSKTMTLLGVKYTKEEVRFLGGEGTINIDGNSTLDYQFGVQISVDDVGPILNPDFEVSDPKIPKLGWRYLWVLYGKDVDTEGLIKPKPRAVYVEKLFRTADLNALFRA